jgi:ABC transporter, ATP-binding protein
MLIVKNLHKKFGNNEVLRGIDFEMKKGEFVAVMGPSGCGKSTFLYCISGMDTVSEGEVYFDTEPMAKLKEKEMSKIRLEKMGFIFQKVDFLKNLSIEDNIVFPALELRKYSNEMIYASAQKLMDRMGIGGIAKNDVREASGGQLQRAAICRAIINQPGIIFGDEPTGALNQKTGAEVMDLLLEINKEGTAVLLVTHDPKVAARADRVLFMRDGLIEKNMVFEKDENIEERNAKVLKTMAENNI